MITDQTGSDGNAKKKKMEDRDLRSCASDSPDWASQCNDVRGRVGIGERYSGDDAARCRERCQ